MVSEAFQTAASSANASLPLRGNIAGQAEALPAPPSTRQAIYAELRAQVDRDDIAFNLARLEPALARRVRVVVGIGMVIAAGIGGLLAIGGI